MREIEAVRDPVRVGTYEIPPLYPEWLGDRAFLAAHGVRFPYASGSMANGIATPQLVAALGHAGLLGFFGAAGLTLERVERGLDEIERLLDPSTTRAAWGANFIHSPHEPRLEERLAELYLARGVPCVEASAFMGLTPSLVRLAVSGLHVGEDGAIRRARNLMAKISRPEVARHFFAPAPAALLDALLAQGLITPHEAELAAQVPLATDVTVEADSGGHTDNRPLGALLPTIVAQRDGIAGAAGVRVGAAGGLGTPTAVAAAFALGAAYVVTGSVNQCAVEAGLSDDGKRMLARAGVADVAMAAAADMFELGVKLQVLKQGTLFAPRANQLYEIYREHAGIDALPAAARAQVEGIFGVPLAQAWRDTERYWRGRDADELARAHDDPKHRMALLFRWYLGKSSRWAIDGDAARRADYQIWCGPAMGAFNAWVAGSFLEDLGQRTAVQIALNLLEGAAVVTRAHQLRSFGVDVPAEAFVFRPRPLG